MKKYEKNITGAINEGNYKVEITNLERIGIRDINLITKMDDFRYALFEMSDWSQVQAIKDSIPDRENGEIRTEDLEKEYFATALDEAFNHPMFVSETLVKAVCIGLNWFKVPALPPMMFKDVYDIALEECKSFYTDEQKTSISITETRDLLSKMFSDILTDSGYTEWDGTKTFKISTRDVKWFITSLADLKTVTTGKKGSKVSTTQFKSIKIQRAYANACRVFVSALGLEKIGKEVIIKGY